MLLESSCLNKLLHLCDSTNLDATEISRTETNLWKICFPVYLNIKNACGNILYLKQFHGRQLNIQRFDSLSQEPRFASGEIQQNRRTHRKFIKQLHANFISLSRAVHRRLGSNNSAYVVIQPHGLCIYKGSPHAAHILIQTCMPYH